MIKKYLKFIFNSKFFWKKTEKFDILIFDCEAFKDILKILPNKNYKIISTRYNKINEIYLNKKIIAKMFKNLFRLTMKQNYLTSLIEAIMPKVVITHIPHSIDFYVVAKELKNKIKFIAIQHGHHDILSLPRDLQKKIFIPELICFSKYEEKIYKKKNYKIDKFDSIGSLRASLSLEYAKLQKINTDENTYDICLVSEHALDKDLFPSNGDFELIPNYSDHVGKIAEFSYRLSKENNLSIIFSGNTEPNTKYKDIEINFYKKFLKDYNFKIDQGYADNYPTYINLMRSKIVIGGYSTVMREALGFGKKILSCNFTGNPSINFPIKGVCLFMKDSYEDFKNTVLQIISMNNDDYFKLLETDKNFAMMPPYNTADTLRKKFLNYLN